MGVCSLVSSGLKTRGETVWICSLMAPWLPERTKLLTHLLNKPSKSSKQNLRGFGSNLSAEVQEMPPTYPPFSQAWLPLHRSE